MSGSVRTARRGGQAPGCVAPFVRVWAGFGQRDGTRRARLVAGRGPALWRWPRTSGLGRAARVPGGRSSGVGPWFPPVSRVFRADDVIDGEYSQVVDGPSVAELPAVVGIGSTMAKPDYLKHIGTRRRGARRSDQTCTVVLLAPGRALLPSVARQRLGLAGWPPDRDIELGSVAPRESTSVTGRRRGRADCWVFMRSDQPGEPSTGRYDRRSEAVESCAVEAIDGYAARQSFDNERWQQRRPSDN